MITPISLCAHARLLASLIPIAPGSPEWIAGGLHPKAYQGGGHPAYGWRHEIKSEQDVLAALSNALWRNIYFLNAPKRMGDYGWAGQPVGSKSEPLGNGMWIDENGHVCFNSEYGEQASSSEPKVLRISGYDLQHLWIGKLIAAYDSPLSANMKLGGFKVRTLIEWTVRGIMASVAGQVRNLSWAEKDYPNHRAAFCVLRATYLAKQRGMIDDQDFNAIAKWFLVVVLPVCEGPTRTWNDYDFKKQGLTPELTQNPLQYEQVYNMRNWLLCVLYDYWDKMEGIPNALRDRIADVVIRWCNYVRSITPSTVGVSFPDSMLSCCPDTWADATLHYRQGDAAPEWAARTFHVAGVVLGDQSLIQTAINIAAAHPAATQWNVSASGEALGKAVGVKP